MIKPLKQTLNVGEHTQVITIQSGRILKFTCDCKHYTFNASNWEEGGTLCWHIKSALGVAQRRANGICRSQ